MNFINQVMHGDCLDVLRRLPDGCVDAIVTDPPYGIGYASRVNGRVLNDERPFIWWLPEAFRVLKVTGAMLCFTRWDVDAFWRQAARAAGFRPKGQLVWNRMVHGMGDCVGDVAPMHDTAFLATKGRFRWPGPRLKSVQTHQRPMGRARLAHPTEKPVELMRTLVEAVTAPGQLVLDPFSGSGACALAAQQAGRRFVAIELEERYVAMARQRLMAA